MKERLLLKQHEVTGFGLMLGYIGVLLMLIGGIVLLPLLTLLWYPEEAYEAKYFILPGIGSILLGYLLFYNIRGRETGRLQRNQDAVIVVTCWILAIMICGAYLPPVSDAPQHHSVFWRYRTCAGHAFRLIRHVWDAPVCG